MEQMTNRYEAAGAPGRPAAWGEDEGRSGRMSAHRRTQRSGAHEDDEGELEEWSK